MKANVNTMDIQVAQQIFLSHLVQSSSLSNVIFRQARLSFRSRNNTRRSHSAAENKASSDRTLMRLLPPVGSTPEAFGAAGVRNRS
jgi:hypothetical protein